MDIGPDSKKWWMIYFKENAGDDAVNKLCDDSGEDKCFGKGHPSEGGIGFTAVYATEAELEVIAKDHAEDLEFIEPDLPMHLPPHEMDGTQDSQDEEDATPLTSWGNGGASLVESDADASQP